MHLRSPIDPGDCRSDWRFGFAEDKGNSVYESYEVKALLGAEIERDLVGDDEAIIREIIKIHQPNCGVLTVRAKRHGLFTSEPGHELLVGRDETITDHALNYCTEFVDHFLGTCWLFGNLWIQPLQR